MAEPSNTKGNGEGDGKGEEDEKRDECFKAIHYISIGIMGSVMGRRGWKGCESLLGEGMRRRDAFIVYIKESQLTMADIGRRLGHSRQYIQWLTKNPISYETARRLEMECGLPKGELENVKVGK